MQVRQVSCGGRVLSYTLTRKPVKNVNLRIKKDGSVRVSAHSRVPVRWIDDFVRKNGAYIITVLEKYERERENSFDAPRQYISGEQLMLLGRLVTLRVIRSEREGADLSEDGKELLLMVRDTEKLRHKELVMERWLDGYCRALFLAISDRTYQVFKSHGYHVPYPVIKIRRMKALWGSCRPDTGVITLNRHLIEKPQSFIEYIMLHEYAHFIQRNHSRQFYALVSSLMPDWKERQIQGVH